MNAVLLAPHHDDETLFAAFTLIDAGPHVITVLRSDLQASRNGITNARRVAETTAAIRELGDGNITHEFWPFSDADPDWVGISRLIAGLAAQGAPVFAPAVHVGGHPHHNELGQIAKTVVPWNRLRLYTTYVDGRTRVPGIEVVPEPSWISRKLRALACYESQIGLWPHHFLGEQREYYAQ